MSPLKVLSLRQRFQCKCSRECHRVPVVWQFVWCAVFAVCDKVFSLGVHLMLGYVNPDAFDTLHSYANTFQMPFVAPWFPQKVSNLVPPWFPQHVSNPAPLRFQEKVSKSEPLWLPQKLSRPVPLWFSQGVSNPVPLGCPQKANSPVSIWFPQVSNPVPRW